MSRSRRVTRALSLAGGMTAAVALAAPLPAFAQTVIVGEGADPPVAVNLDVLDSLAPATGGTQAVGAGQPDPGGSVLLAQPSSSGSDFAFPVVPETKPEQPAGAAATTTTTVTQAADGSTTMAPAPEPKPDEAAARELAEAVEAEAAAIATGTTGEAATDEAFGQIDDMLSEPVEPDEIEVPEPEMTLGEGTVAASPPPEPAGIQALQIVFAAGDDAMSEDDRTMLKQLAGRLSQDPDQRIQLRAYASSDDGTASAARRLALARALAVRAFLIENDVRSTRIDVRALGDKVEGEGPLDRIDIVLVES